MPFKKNTAVTGFAFAMVDASDGSAITSGTVTGRYLLDGGTQGTIAGTPVHEGNGQWSVNLTAGEMNGDLVGLLFTHASAIPVHFTIKTETKLVSELNDIAATDVVSAGAITTSSGAVSTVSTVNALGSQAKLDVNAEVDTALNTAIPGSPTADSINERVAAIDDKLPTGNISDFDESSDNVTLAAAVHAGATIPIVTDIANDVNINMSQNVPSPGAADSTGEQLDKIRDNIDATVSSRSSHAAADIWSVGTRTVSAATNITSTGNAVNLYTDDKVLLAATTHTGAIIPSVTTVTGNVDGSVGSVTGAVGSVTGNVGGSVASVTAAVNVGQWNGTAVSVGATSNFPKVDAHAISDSTEAADDIEAASETMIEETVQADDRTTTTFRGSSGLSATNDFYNGRLVIFTSGSLTNQMTDITDYTGATRLFTVTAMTAAPAENDTFMIV